MDFYEVLDQIRGLLQTRGRVTYRALKVQFQLDDDHLEALKDELIEAEQVAADENGKLLVWTGNLDAAPETASPSLQQASYPAAQDDKPMDVEAPSPEPSTPDAERRVSDRAPHRSPLPLLHICQRSFRLGQPEQARAELSTAIEMYRDMEMTFWLPETEAALADVEQR